MFLSQQIPLLFMSLRLNVFDDENCRVKKEDEMGNIHYENTLGYNPIIYYFIGFPISILIGICLTDYVKDILVSSYFTSNLLQSIFLIAVLFLLYTNSCNSRNIAHFYNLKTNCQILNKYF